MNFVNYKVLVADDDKAITGIIGSSLKREGYDTILAHDGQEAVLKIKEGDPDIILLDLLMPKMGGLEVLKEIRTKYNDRWRPVIIISAAGDLGSVITGYKMEADHYFTKPCVLDSLLRGVMAMISLIPQRKA